MIMFLTGQAVSGQANTRILQCDTVIGKQAPMKASRVDCLGLARAVEYHSRPGRRGSSTGAVSRTLPGSGLRCILAGPRWMRSAWVRPERF